MRVSLKFTDFFLEAMPLLEPLGCARLGPSSVRTTAVIIKWFLPQELAGPLQVKDGARSAEMLSAVRD